VRALLLAWADTETSLGHSFRAVSPPRDARAGNTLLSRGELTFGSEIRFVATHLPRKRSRVGPFIESRLAAAKGAAMIDRALAVLKKAGYRVG
jgi:hypothetical protein